MRPAFACLAALVFLVVPLSGCYAAPPLNEGSPDRTAPARPQGDNGDADPSAGGQTTAGPPPTGQETDGAAPTSPTTSEAPTDASPEPTDPPAEPAQQPTEPAGLRATFTMQGDPLHVFFPTTTIDATCPCVLRPEPLFPSDAALMYFQNATVEGHGEGLLIVQASNLTVEPTGPVAIDVDAVRATDRVTLEPDLFGSLVPKPDLRIQSEWDAANRSFFFAKHMPFDAAGWTLDGADRAVFWDGTDAINVTGPVEVSAVGLWWARDSRVDVAAADVAPGRFAAGGNTTNGFLDFEDRADVPDPLSVVGRGGGLEIQPGRIGTTTAARVTQASDADGLVLESHVTLKAKEDRLETTNGTTRWLAVEYAETTRVGDAVLENVTVTGSAADFVTIPIEQPPGLLASLWETVDETEGWGQAIAAFGVAIASPAVAIADFLVALACAFSTCPQLHPYPTWMDAGSSGTFYYHVDIGADVEPGTYEATITMIGYNHDPVDWDVVIVVEE